MANALAVDLRTTCIDDIEPDVRSNAGIAKLARSIHQCLSYLSHEVEQMGDTQLSDAVEHAILMAEDVIRRYPDYRN
ncbi:hypothetical protein [Novispirillum itersonii]|uniref:hypothetical protein n=1 Tax=Novispirillum itersonii TaxID=189 RepID=UPI00035DB0E6|nr:hypothetical protein [Novispirillum itersonii]